MTWTIVDWLSVVTPLVHHWLRIHAEQGRFRLVVTPETRSCWSG